MVFFIDIKISTSDLNPGLPSERVRNWVNVENRFAFRFEDPIRQECNQCCNAQLPLADTATLQPVILRQNGNTHLRSTVHVSLMTPNDMIIDDGWGGNRIMPQSGVPLSTRVYDGHEIWFTTISCIFLTSRSGQLLMNEILDHPSMAGEEYFILKFQIV